MAMTMEQQNRHLGSVGFDHLSYSGPGPQFSNPWGATSSGHSGAHLYPTALGTSNNFDALAKTQAVRANSVSMPYTSMAGSAPSVGASSGYSNGSYAQPDLLNLSHDLVNSSRSTYDQGYSAAPTSSANAYAPTSSPYLTPFGNLSQQQDSRRLSQQSSSSESQASFDAIDAGRGMLAMSQSDLTTPRNIYGPRGDRGNTDAYGFPSPHSSHSSISSTSTYPSYYSNSGDTSSVSDYSSQSEMDPINSRTLPRPSGLVGTVAPPAPQSMMGQFNSKISSSTQKKHKCKVCDKRFTRPSSLQTHMYSHTGEKPYACEADGCGRHFSVVSNLRRHRKVHKTDRSSDHESPEGSWVTDK